MNLKEKFKEKIKKIPLSPGVYLFLDKNKKVLYVGKAISLKKRILNYFQNNLDPRLKEMINLAYDIKIFKTNNHLEALILEANLIKKYWPKYNIKDKDFKSFIYIVIVKKPYTKPILIRGKDLERVLLKQAEVFGPYQSLNLVKTALRILRRIFPYSVCKINQGRPCFDYQIGLCPGICFKKISEEEYQKNIDNLILVLKGENKILIEKLKKEEPDKIKALKHLEDVALIKEETLLNLKKIKRIEGYDISHLSGKNSYGAMVVFEDNVFKKSDYRIFKIKEAPEKDDLRALKEVILRRLKHQEWAFPDLILIDGGKPQIDFLNQVFKEEKIKIPFFGISKYQNDKFIFPKNFKKNLKELILENQSIFLKIREEAHRFSKKFNIKSRKIK